MTKDFVWLLFGADAYSPWMSSLRHIGGVKCNSNHQIWRCWCCADLKHFFKRCTRMVVCFACPRVVLCDCLRVCLWDTRGHCWLIGRRFLHLYATCRFVQGHVYLGDRSWLELWIEIWPQSRRQHIQVQKSWESHTCWFLLGQDRMIYLLRVGDLLGVVFVSVLVEWEVVDLGKGACLWVLEKGGFSWFWVLLERLGLKLASGLDFTGIGFSWSLLCEITFFQKDLSNASK